MAGSETTLSFRASDVHHEARDLNVKSLISDDVIANSNFLHESFDKAKPFRHVVIDGFLRPEVAERMYAEFPAVEDASTLLNEFGDPGQKSQISEVRQLGGVYADMDGYIQTPEFLDLMGALTGIPDLRYDPFYFGAGTHENLHGAGLDAHYDFNIHPKTRQHRRLNAIIYLNKDWNPEWKGSIALHSDPWDLKDDDITEIAPIFNRCVIFETNEHSWHSVIPVDLPEDKRHLSRKSFTIYLYTDVRPEEEAAPEHGTIYVQAPLSKRIRAGVTLTDEDIAEMDANMLRRHYMLRQLYKREYKFAAIIDDLKAQVKELRAHSYVPLVGYGKIASVVEPLFTDGWLGDRVAFTVEPLRPVKGVRVAGWSRDDVAEDFAVTIKFADSVKTTMVRAGVFEFELTLPEPVTTTSMLTVESDWVRRAGGNDERMLSVIINAIELIH